MCAYKDNTDFEELKKREYLKQQHQLRNMTKTTNVLSADDMIENLLSKKEIFKMKKESSNPSKNKSGQLTPHWLFSGHEPPLYKRVWEMVGSSTGYADTPKLTNILLTSRLTTDVLGYIWSLSNSNLGPALLQQDTYTALALVALSQNGYGFTSSAVLNNLKEAPVPNIEVGLTEAPAETIAEVPTVTAMCSFAPVLPNNLTSLNVMTASNYKNQVLSSVTSEFASKSTTPIATSPVAPSAVKSAVSFLSENLSLLDFDMPSSLSTHKSVSNSSSIYDEDPLFMPINHIQDSIKSMISEASNVLGNGIIKPETVIGTNDIDKLTNVNFQEKEILNTSDDLFGDFQSVRFDQEKTASNDEIEFDDFKSADFTPLTVLEVKEKPPEESYTKIKSVPPKSILKVPSSGSVLKVSSSESVFKLAAEPAFKDTTEPIIPGSLTDHEQTISSVEKTAGVEDLFPRCVVKPKEDGEDLFAEEEDKYSALRGLTTTEESDEFGDFLTATPSQPLSLLPPLVEYQSNIQEKAMDACLDILEEAKRIFLSIKDTQVLNEVVSDPKGVQYLEELIEVERIAQRLMLALNKEEFTNKLDNLSKALLRFLEPHKNSYMVEENGPKCGICLSERGPAYVKYGLNNFHAPCANLYLHKVDSNLPIAPVM